MCQKQQNREMGTTEGHGHPQIVKLTTRVYSPPKFSSDKYICLIGSLSLRILLLIAKSILTDSDPTAIGKLEEIWRKKRGSHAESCLKERPANQSPCPTALHVRCHHNGSSIYCVPTTSGTSSPTGRYHIVSALPPSSRVAALAPSVTVSGDRVARW